MSTNNQISVEIPQDVVNKVAAMLQDVKKMLAPYLQGLTNEERGELFKMGDKTVATVSKVKSYLDTNPEFVPKYMDVKEFLKDEKAVSQLSPIANVLAQLSSDAQDTVMLAGSEALLGGMPYYHSVKNAANDGIPAAETIYEDLKQRFITKSRRKPPTES